MNNAPTGCKTSAVVALLEIVLGSKPLSRNALWTLSSSLNPSLAGEQDPGVSWLKPRALQPFIYERDCIRSVAGPIIPIAIK